MESSPDIDKLCLRDSARGSDSPWNLALCYSLSSSSMEDPLPRTICTHWCKTTWYWLWDHYKFDPYSLTSKLSLWSLSVSILQNSTRLDRCIFLQASQELAVYEELWWRVILIAMKSLHSTGHRKKPQNTNNPPKKNQKKPQHQTPTNRIKGTSYFKSGLIFIYLLCLLCPLKLF